MRCCGFRYREICDYCLGRITYYGERSVPLINAITFVGAWLERIDIDVRRDRLRRIRCGASGQNGQRSRLAADVQSPFIISLLNCANDGALILGQHRPAKERK
jgi:hypothetical protein